MAIRVMINEVPQEKKLFQFLEGDKRFEVLPFTLCPELKIKFRKIFLVRNERKILSLKPFVSIDFSKKNVFLYIKNQIPFITNEKIFVPKGVVLPFSNLRIIVKSIILLNEKEEGNLFDLIKQ